MPRWWEKPGTYACHIVYPCSPTSPPPPVHKSYMSHSNSSPREKDRAPALSPCYPFMLFDAQSSLDPHGPDFPPAALSLPPGDTMCRTISLLRGEPSGDLGGLFHPVACQHLLVVRHHLTLGVLRCLAGTQRLRQDMPGLLITPLSSHRRSSTIEHGLLPDTQARWLFKQISSGFDCSLLLNIVHRGLECKNVELPQIRTCPRCVIPFVPGNQQLIHSCAACADPETTCPCSGLDLKPFNPADKGTVITYRAESTGDLQRVPKCINGIIVELGVRKEADEHENKVDTDIEGSAAHGLRGLATSAGMAGSDFECEGNSESTSSTSFPSATLLVPTKSTRRSTRWLLARPALPMPSPSTSMMSPSVSHLVRVVMSGDVPVMPVHTDLSLATEHAADDATCPLRREHCLGATRVIRRPETAPRQYIPWHDITYIKPAVYMGGRARPIWRRFAPHSRRGGFLMYLAVLGVVIVAVSRDQSTLVFKVLPVGATCRIWPAHFFVKARFSVTQQWHCNGRRWVDKYLTVLTLVELDSGAAPDVERWDVSVLHDCYVVLWCEWTTVPYDDPQGGCNWRGTVCLAAHCDMCGLDSHILDPYGNYESTAGFQPPHSHPAEAAGALLLCLTSTMPLDSPAPSPFVAPLLPAHATSPCPRTWPLTCSCTLAKLPAACNAHAQSAAASSLPAVVWGIALPPPPGASDNLALQLTLANVLHPTAARLPGVTPPSWCSQKLALPAAQDYTSLMLPSKSILTGSIRAGVMCSFGFGQVGSTCLIVNPRYLLGTLELSAYMNYKARHQAGRQGDGQDSNQQLAHAQDGWPAVHKGGRGEYDAEPARAHAATGSCTFL
ncbi:uncharacterized protein B0H18DRAFT_958142 [Fomitopsis serialis]|uniref:uncharacterized protein n=1 Tax=Fomitopsis serialis TaxID=139415 RepID=UPI00200794AD|nr:uncharacterized protein B0H18DRAFT_958142 [Neoantrodia serialis]KAH9917943.1 hypothetical protein B0H18DRAFT_958142 [Neoantrodia serialis]